MTNWRKNLEDMGGYENELVAVPAGGVRLLIAEFEDLQKQLAEREKQLANAVKILSDQDFEYNRKTNALIKRHVKQLAERDQKRDAALLRQMKHKSGKGSTMGFLEYWAQARESGEWNPELEVK
jgi:hypothetical protein